MVVECTQRVERARSLVQSIAGLSERLFWPGRMNLMPHPPKKIVRGHTVSPRNPKGRREGFTTGTAAAAAAKAACLLLLKEAWPEVVLVQLPIPRVLEIRINTLESDGETA